ncbi:MAG: Ig-like domain-containing protein, partial [Flavobacterium sp.]
MRFKIILLLFFSFLFLNCSSDDDRKKTVEQKKISIELKINQKQLLKSEQISLLDQLILSNVSLSELYWDSSNPEIVEVNKDIVKAKAKGESIITIGIKDTDKKASLKIIVSDSRVSFKQEQIMISSKDKDYDLNSLLILENISKDKVLWTSSNNDVVKVNNGVLKALGQGEVTINAKIKNTDQEASILVVVDQMKMYFSKEVIYVDAKKIKTLDINEYLITENIDRNKIVWGSAGSNFISVKKGIITIHNDGDAEILADLVEQNIRVIMRVVSTGIGTTSINIVSPWYGNKLLKGRSYQYTIQPFPYTENLSNFVWKSSNENIAKIDNNGFVEAKSEGQAILTVIAPSGVKATVEVDVIPNEVTDIYLGLPMGIDGKQIIAGESSQMSIMVTPYELNSLALDLKSSDPSMASVDQYGLISTVKGKKGKFSIIASSKTNPAMKATLEIELLGPFYSFYSNVTLLGQIKNGNISGEVTFKVINKHPYFHSNISEFKVYDSTGKLLYENNSLNTFSEDWSYYFNL